MGSDRPQIPVWLSVLTHSCGRQTQLCSRTARQGRVVWAGRVRHSPDAGSCLVGGLAVPPLWAMVGCGKGDYCDHGLGRVGGQVLTSQDEGAGPVNWGVSPPRRTFLRRLRVDFSSDLRRSAPVSVVVGVSRDGCGGLRVSGRVSNRQLPQWLCRVCRLGLHEPLERAGERISRGFRRSPGGQQEVGHRLRSGQAKGALTVRPCSARPGTGQTLSAGAGEEAAPHRPASRRATWAPAGVGRLVASPKDGSPRCGPVTLGRGQSGERAAGPGGWRGGGTEAGDGDALRCALRCATSRGPPPAGLGSACGHGGECATQASHTGKRP